MSAFFLEAGFLGTMLFGLNKVGPRLHFAATALVAVGTLISAGWILLQRISAATISAQTAAPPATGV